MMVVNVRKYKRRDGTRVVSHKRSNPSVDDLAFKAGDRMPDKKAPVKKKGSLKDLVKKKSPKSKFKAGDRIPVIKVEFIWAEGFSNMPANKGLVFEGVDAIERANGYLVWASQFASRGGGYDKHKIKVLWADGDSYEGRWDVKYDGTDTNISEYIKDVYEYALKQEKGSPYYVEGGERKEAEDFLKNKSLPIGVIPYSNASVEAEIDKILSEKEVCAETPSGDKATSLKSKLSQFHGTEQYHKLTLGPLKATDGVAFLANEAKAFWLIDVIASYQSGLKAKGINFQVWTLEVKNNKGVVRAYEDLPGKAVVTQKIAFTDFPLQEIKLFVVDDVVMLPGEY